MISISPGIEHFAIAEGDLAHAADDDYSDVHFPFLVALIVAAIRNTDGHVVNVTRLIDPIVGERHAGHLIWLIDILSGSANGQHFWNWSSPSGRLVLHEPDLGLNY